MGSNTKLNSLEGYPDRWKGAKYIGNMIDTDVFGVQLHYWPSESDPDAPGSDVRVTSLAAAKAQWPLVWEASNNTNAPTYVNAAANYR